MYDPLISGKDNTEKVINIEIIDNTTALFIQNKDGSIKKEVRPNKFWILTNIQTKGSFKLKGELHYKYGTQFNSKKEWNDFNYQLRKKNIDTYTIYDPKESHMVNRGITYYKGMTHTEPSILSFDIESTGLFHNAESKVLLISNTFRKNGQTIRKLFAYDEYSGDEDFFRSWIDWVNSVDPSIICGHNIYTYDLPYIKYCMDRVDLEFRIGRDGSELSISPKASKFRIDGSRDQEYHKVRCYGREIIDTMFLAIRHDIVAKKYDSYGLKNIIKQEGLEKNDRVFYDASQIRFNYRNPDEWKRIKEYCIHDSDDALAVFDLTAPASFYLTQSIPKSFQSVVETASGSQINSMMVRSYLQDGHSIPKASLPRPFEGAISFGNPGIYRNVHKIDVEAMYPNIVLACKVYDEDKDPNGNFLKIMEIFTAERVKNKKLFKETGNNYYDGLQNAQKIIVNSGYGFMAAPGLNFNSPECAEFITKTGRDILSSTIQWSDAKKNRIVNADTDSISYTKEDQSEFTQEERDEALKEVNSLFPERIKFADDGYFKTVVVCAGKNYILDDGKKVKMKGSALKASTKSQALKDMIKDIVDSILKGRNDFTDIYNKYIKEATRVTDIKRWASRKTISERTLNSERKNETRIKDAIQGTEIVEGDRIWVYNKNKEELALVEQFDGNYDIDKLLGQVYDTVWIFDEVLDCETLFKNYKLKKSKQALEELLDDQRTIRQDYRNDQKDVSRELA